VFLGRVDRGRGGEDGRPRAGVVGWIGSRKVFKEVYGEVKTRVAEEIERA
jgi:hypothetical protein